MLSGTLQQQHQNKIRPSPPATAKNYYVRLVPWTSNGTHSWAVSPTVRISYSSRFQKGGSGLTSVLKFTDVRVSTNQISLLRPEIQGVYHIISMPSSQFVCYSLTA